MVRNVCKFVVLSSVVVLVQPLNSEDPELRPCHIPGYIWGIIGSLSSLLLIVTLLLIFVLVKSKFYYEFLGNEHRSPPSPGNLEEEYNETDTYRPMKKSFKRQNLEKSNNEPKTDNDKHLPLKRQDSCVTIKSDYNTSYAPRKPESLDVAPKFMKNVIKDMPIILPEQMSQICREVLKHKNNKNDDLKGSLQNIDQLAKEGQEEIKVELKYASTPELDIYDELSSSSTGAAENDTTNANNQSEKSNKSEEKDEPKIKASPSRQNSASNQLKPSCDIYDFPKEVNSNALEVCDIYDMPKTPSPAASKKQKQGDYIVAYFPSEKVAEPFKSAEDKPTYAHIREISKTEQTESVTDNKVENINLDEQYEIPAQILNPDQNNMYINANENIFMS